MFLLAGGSSLYGCLAILARNSSSKMELISGSFSLAGSGSFGGSFSASAAGGAGSIVSGLMGLNGSVATASLASRIASAFWSAYSLKDATGDGCSSMISGLEFVVVLPLLVVRRILFGAGSGSSKLFCELRFAALSWSQSSFASSQSCSASGNPLVPSLAYLVWFGLVWFGLVWFGLVWFGF